MNTTDPRSAATSLEREAEEILNRAFLRIPDGMGSSSSKRLVECIVGAAMLRLAIMQAEALKALKPV